MQTNAYGSLTIVDLLDDATYIYYADNSLGSGASLSPTGKSYIGIYSGAALSTGQPNPGTTEYNNIFSQIQWSKYAGTSVNLYTGSSQFSGDWINKFAWTDTQTTDTLGNKIYSKTSAWQGIYQLVSATKGDTFTWSANVKNSAQETVHLYIVEFNEKKQSIPGGNNVNGDYKISISTVEQRFSGTYTIVNDNCKYICMRLESANSTNTLYISSLKLERGNTATGWCPAMGGIISTSVTYQVGTSSTNAPTGTWATSPPALESGEFLWTKTELLLENGTTSTSYSVSAKGEDGLDGDRFLIQTSHERILKFNERSRIKFSPEILKFSVYELTEEAPVPVTFKMELSDDAQRKASYKIQILASNEKFYDVPNDYNYQVDLANETEKIPTFFLLNFYNFLTEQNSVSTVASEEGLTEDNYLNVLTALESESTYIRFIYLEDGAEKAYKEIEIANGVSNEMAKFNITATEINAAVQDRVMSFDATGLHILNGGFDIKTENYKAVDFEEGEDFLNNVEYYEYDSQKKDYFLTEDKSRDTEKIYYITNQELLLGYTGEGLYIKGNGVFTGEVQASSGSFSGKIIASGGQIGGFTIKKNTLTSEDNNLILQGGEDSKITVNTIELGTGAIIKDYLQLGEGIKLYGNSERPRVFEIEKTDGESVNSVLSIQRDGTLILGDKNSNYLALDGTAKTISTSSYSSSGGGRGWYLSEDKSYFNDVTVRGKLEAAVFETGKVSAVGGILLIRPSTKIASIETVDGNSIIELEDDAGFAGADDKKGPEYYYLVATSGEAIYCYTASKISNKKITLTSEIEDVFLSATIINYGQKGSIGLGVNGSTNDSAIPSSSFSVFEWAPELKEENGTTQVVAGKNYPIILGKLPNGDRYKDFAGKYGLYAENVLLKGALVAETAGAEKVYSGISTADQDKPPLSNAILFPKTYSEILLWAGAQGTDKDSIEKSNFYVDRNGNLYANSGYFSGTIITKAEITASKLTAAHIYGEEDELALTIQDDKGTQFLTSLGDLIMSVDSSGVKIAEGMNFTIGGSIFSSSKLGTSSLFISNPEKTTASVKISLPNSNDTSNKGKISFSNSLTDNKDNQATEDYAILEDSGLKIQADGSDILGITGNDFSVNRDIYLAKDIYYGKDIKYAQVVGNNKIIGYDLYI